MDDLTDATVLIAELTSKLAELDRKVAVYRLGMAAEFTKHSEELLNNVPKHLAYRVSRAIEDSLPNYPSLYPSATLDLSRPTTPANPEEVSWSGNRSPPPVLPHTSGNPKDPLLLQDQSLQKLQTIQRARDQELRGLFVPSYLPLLESVDRPLHSPPASPVAVVTPGPDATLSVATTKPSKETPPEDCRPSPLRRTTDTSVESAASDGSSTKIRKSALRRSPASMKADSPRDPRRVRFDFEGQEVLPSSPPQMSIDAITKPDAAARPEDSSALADESYTTSLGDIDGEQDQHSGKPKKVSSTQALRALSKTPLDEGTVWTVVNPAAVSDDSPDLDKTTRKTPEAGLASQSSTGNDKMDDDKTAENEPKVEVGINVFSRTNRKPREVQSESESDNEPALFMASKRRGKKSKKTSRQDDEVPSLDAAKPASPIVAPQPTISTAEPILPTPTTASPHTFTSMDENLNPTGKETSRSKLQSAVSNLEDDDSELFAFDDDETRGDKAEKYLPEPHGDDDDTEPEEEQLAQSAGASKTYSGLPSSPPINFPVRPPPNLQHEIPTNDTSHSEGTRLASMSIGSLGKMSLMPGPVKDQELLEKVTKMDVEVPFFVGSVNGRSGPDASNIRSYQASLMSPTQTSGSFAERLMWEKSQGVMYDSDTEGAKKSRR